MPNATAMTLLQIIELIGMFLLFGEVNSEKTKQNEFIQQFQQHDYQVKVERLTLVRFNKNYVDMNIKTFKYNRTCTAFNISLNAKADFGNLIEVVVQAYKFASNEYRLFPMRFEVNVCDAFSQNLGGIAEFSKCGNFKGCPIQKGKIQVGNFVPDGSQLPPLIPNGKYMWELQFMYLSEELVLLQVLLEITRPLAVP